MDKVLIEDKDSIYECQDCIYFETIYHEWDCSGTWTSEDKCVNGYYLEDMTPYDCEEFIYNGGE